MDVLDLTVGTAEADVAPAGLVIPGVGYGGNLLVAVHGGDQNFNIIGSGHGCGAVACGQLHGTEMQAQTGNQILRLVYQLLESLVRALGSCVLEHLYLVELMAPDHAPLVGAVGTGLPAEAGGIGEELLGKIGLGEDFIPVNGSKRCLGGGQHIVHPVVGGIGDLVDFICKLGELTGSQAALVLQHVGRQDEFVAVSHVAVDEVVQQSPLQAGAHAGIDPVSGTGQLDAPLVVDEAQVLAQVHMVLGLKIKGMLLADVAQRLVVLLAAGEQIGVRHIGQGQHAGGQLVIQLLELLLVLGDFLADLHGSGHVGVDLGFQSGSILALLFRTLLLAEELAVFLGKLVLLCGLGLGMVLQATDLDVQLQNAVNGGVAVHFLGLHTGLDGIGIFFDSLDIDHDNYLSWLIFLMTYFFRFIRASSRFCRSS